MGKQHEDAFEAERHKPVVYTKVEANAIQAAHEARACGPVEERDPVPKRVDPFTFEHVKDSGERSEFVTGAVRDRQSGKGRYDLLSPIALRRLAKHFENGATKYSDRNWEKGMPLSRYLDSALRHIFSILEGKTDEDHAAAAEWNMHAFMHTQEKIVSGALPEALDDLPHP